MENQSCFEIPNQYSSHITYIAKHLKKTNKTNF